MKRPLNDSPLVRIPLGIKRLLNEMAVAEERTLATILSRLITKEHKATIGRKPAQRKAG